MECDRRGVIWSLWLVVVVAMVWAPPGCGGSSDTEDSQPTSQPDTGESVPEISISRECESACANFMDKCGKMVPATQSDCEFDCETNWSIQVTSCVNEAAVCTEIEACEDGGGGSGADAGSTGDGGAPAPDTGGDATGAVDGGSSDAADATGTADE